MILFVAHRPHQEVYFRALCRHIQMPCAVLGLARWTWPGWAGLARAWRDGADIAAAIDPQLRKKAAKRGPLGRLFGTVYRSGLTLRARLYRARVVAELERAEVRAVAVWNGYGWIGRLVRAAAAARGVPVVHFENGLLPGTTTMDPHGVNFLNSVPRDPAYFRALPDAPPLPVTLAPRAGPAGERAVALPPRYVFVPFQLDADTQILEFSPWIANMRALHDLLVGLRDAAEAAQLVFVVKEHPSSPVRYPDLHGRHPHILFANGNSTQALIEGAAGVITVNSTAGLEAALLGRPVLALGQAFYAITGIAAHADGQDDVRGWLRTLPDHGPDPSLLRRFAAFLAQQYCIPGRWTAPDAAHHAAVRARFERILAGQPLFDASAGPARQAGSTPSAPATSASAP